MKPLNKKHFEHYFIDTNGNVYSTNSQRGSVWKNGPKKIKSYPNKNTNYHQIVLQNGTKGIKPTSFYIHRLVAETYIPNPYNLPEVNHIIPDKNNNSVGNLEWVTTKQNREHKKLFGVVPNTKIIQLLKDKKLINKGIKHYNNHNDLLHLCDLWNCSITTTKKILNKFSVKRENLRYSNLELKKIRECILEWNNKHYTSKFLLYVRNKVGVETSFHFIRAQIKYLKDLDLMKK